MNRLCTAIGVAGCCLGLAVSFGSRAMGNGGPFVLKYPNGDTAAKGVLARLDPSLKPDREERLRVVKEDLRVAFQTDLLRRPGNAMPPLALVTAEYTIENPTGEAVTVDFGFPILRGIYISPLSMMPRADVAVTLDRQPLNSTILSNSVIYGLIRQRARGVIDKAVDGDAELRRLVDVIRKTDTERETARQALRRRLVESRGWNERDAALMAEYAGLDFGTMRSFPVDRTSPVWFADVELIDLPNSNLGALSAIGEQKATQFLAQLAGKFEPETAASYEAIFQAWGGDVRERCVDLDSGQIRPREISVGPEPVNAPGRVPAASSDPTIYARVDYLDPHATLSEAEAAACKTILKNLPVVFTFAPMNLLHYQATFPARTTSVLVVNYRQYAYKDTRSPTSYQLAYVVHPASLWRDFGPIHLEVAAPQGMRVRTSVPCTNDEVQQRDCTTFGKNKAPYSIYRAVLHEKTGELYIGVDGTSWETFAASLSPGPATAPPTVALSQKGK